MNSNKSLYEDLWEKGWLEELGDPGPSYRSRMRLLMRRIRNLSVETGARILDIGCGNGNLLILASCLIPKPRLFGVDISQNAVEVARKRLPEGRFAECDLAKEPIPFDEKFDLILCSEVLEHIGEPSLVLEKVYAILKPGASFVLSVPAGKDKWGPHDKAVGHLHRFERDEMRGLLEAAGFHVKQCSTWGSWLYDWYYRLLLNKVKPEKTHQKKGSLTRIGLRAFYYLFFLEDLLPDRGKGRMLFAVAQKPSDDPVPDGF